MIFSSLLIVGKQKSRNYFWCSEMWPNKLDFLDLIFQNWQKSGIYIQLCQNKHMHIFMPKKRHNVKNYMHLM